MTQLHQLLAIKQGARTRAQKELTGIYHQWQKPEPFNGITKTYTPKDEEGEQLPGDYQRVQQDAEALLQQMRQALAPMYQVVADVDATNQVASASIVIDGNVIAANVPVATLLWLEKQLVDLSTVVGKIPTLDPQFVWTRDPEQDLWATDPVNTVRSKKVPRNHVKALATDKHPEQVEVFYEDVTVGTWTTRRLSGAMRAADVKALQARIATMQDAVKDARERANRADVVPVTIVPVLDWLIP